MINNDTQSAADFGDRFVTGVATDLDAPLGTVQPTVHERPTLPLRQPETRKAEEEKTERQAQMQRLTIESLVTRAWHERIRQVRGDAMPEIGTRDIHVRNGLIEALMTIVADNPDLSLMEYGQLT